MIGTGLTVDDKAAIETDLKWLIDINEVVMNGFSVNEMNFRTKAGYFDPEAGWNTAHKNTFDDFMGE